MTARKAMEEREDREPEHDSPLLNGESVYIAEAPSEYSEENDANNPPSPKFWPIIFVTSVTFITSFHPILMWAWSDSHADTSVILFLILFTLINLGIGYITLKGLDYRHNEKHLIFSGFFALLFSSWFLTLSTLPDENKQLSFSTSDFVFGVVLCILWFANSIRNELLSKNGFWAICNSSLFAFTYILYLVAERWLIGTLSWSGTHFQEIFLICSFIAFLISLLFLKEEIISSLKKRENLFGLTFFATISFSFSQAALTILSVLVLYLLPIGWFSTLHTVAEWATFSNKPEIVEFCLPKSSNNLYRAQKNSLTRTGYNHLALLHHDTKNADWVEKATAYASEHGDERSALAYLHCAVDKHHIKVIINAALQKRAKSCNMKSMKNLMKESGFMLSDENVQEKQLSFDEPELFNFFSSEDKKSEEFLELILKYNAQKTATALLREKGLGQTFGVSKQTFLQVVVSHKNESMLDFLLKQKTNPDFAVSGKTPRVMAKENQWIYAIKKFEAIPSSPRK